MSCKSIKFIGFGFPVVLANVQTKVVHDEVVPNVNYNDLQVLLFVALIRKPTRLSGAEIRFLRHHLGMTQDGPPALVKGRTVAGDPGVDEQLVFGDQIQTVQRGRELAATEEHAGRSRVLEILHTCA